MIVTDCPVGVCNKCQLLKMVSAYHNRSKPDWMAALRGDSTPSPPPADIVDHEDSHVIVFCGQADAPLLQCGARARDPAPRIQRIPVLIGHPAHKSRHASKAVRGSAYLRGHRSKAVVLNELLECVDSPRSPFAPNVGLRSSG